ncbi:MAG: hypothetical protein CVU57_13840 [Deltaproteobacteria bacterium HGW-Deltaproteobacteria-15]|jgi:type II secretory pathway component PulC|nr:MAG: hypothetical protein CVU57_13840 [Deltaproteobacteria bacterium HGW-Deltaproteobacteria-15]
MKLRRYLLLINVVLTALLGWTAYSVYLSWSADRQRESLTSRAGIPQPVNTSQAGSSSGPSYYQSIIAQDIFGTSKQKPTMEQVEKPKVVEIPVSRRNFSLKGTVVGRNNDSYAVISEARAPEGDVFRVNDMLQNARILEILPDRVILEADGKQEVLVITYDLNTEGQNAPAGAIQRPSGAVPGAEAQKPSSEKMDRNRFPGTVRPPGRK